MDPRNFEAFIPMANEPGIRNKAIRRKQRRLIRKMLRVGLYVGSCGVIGAIAGLALTDTVMSVWHVIFLMAATAYLTFDRCVVQGGVQDEDY